MKNLEGLHGEKSLDAEMRQMKSWLGVHLTTVQ